MVADVVNISSRRSPAQERALHLVRVDRLTITAAVEQVRAEHLPGCLAVNDKNIREMCRRHGWEYERERLYGQLPWKVAREHENFYYAKFLRAWLRQQRGAPVAPTSVKLIETVTAKLRTEQKVITYDPTHDPVFHLVDPRWRKIERGDLVLVDEGWILEPTLNNYGEKI